MHAQLVYYAAAFYLTAEDFVMPASNYIEDSLHKGLVLKCDITLKFTQPTIKINVEVSQNAVLMLEERIQTIIAHMEKQGWLKNVVKLSPT